MTAGFVGVDHLLTPTATAERLAVSTWTVARLRRDGHLAAVRVGGSWRFDPADVAAYITKNRSEG
ncbi:helix-turn-helix domain-containing protein [Nocardioides sp. STR2]|uniref:Helix-turn-helix domain-containing protein n=1 Tax=Nocardioides pini TaxID=2975053 RepID=A0ABT4CD53_9ACTN|nr:helix-turn-helix domain-containing protein [Nocardioides pini]MCY4726736.1 helix-turn-helix domain-containing protein [Nocardioides pini]